MSPLPMGTMKLTFVVKNTPWIHRSDGVAVPIFIPLAVPGMAVLRPNATLHVFLDIDVVVMDDGILYGD